MAVKESFLTFSFSFICFLLFLFYDVSYFSFISNYVDKLKSKQHLISQELVCSCFAIKTKTNMHSSQEVYLNICA